MVIKLAFRNLRRHMRRTLLTVAAIALGTGLALFSIGLGDGGHQQMIENGVRIGQGHLTVQREGFLESPSSSLYVKEPGAWMDVINASDRVDKAFQRIRGEGILATAAGAQGVMYQGIDPTLANEAMIFRDSLTEGEFLTDYNAAHVVMGAKLADRLKLKLGKKVVLTTQDASGEITSTLLRVKGIFRSGSGSIDGSICIIPIGNLQKALNMGKGVTSIAIYLKNPFKQPEALKEIGSKAPPGEAGLYKWQTLQPDLRDFVVIDDAFGYMIYAIILLIVAIGVLNTVLMSVMERRREIGILTAVGMGSRQVMNMIIIETVFITVIGITIGLFIGLAVNWYFSTYGLDLSAMSSQKDWSLAGTVIDPVMRPHLRPHRVFGLCFTVFLLTVTMGIYPAWKASRTLPVEAMEKP
jgi:ABC-type lipoprotein release transport system permease subunit